MVVGFMFMYYYFIIAPTEVTVTGDEFAMGKVQVNSVMTEILTSPDCLSTGEMGVLSEDKLNETDGTDVLDCAYHPSVWAYVKVKDHDKDKKYEFGDSGLVDISGNIGKKEIPVTIDTGSEKNLGTATLQLIHIPHFVASITRAGNIAWHEGGESISLEAINDKEHEIDTDQGKTQEDLEIDVKVGDKGITLPFKGYNVNASLSFEESLITSATKKNDAEPHIEISGEPCIYERGFGLSNYDLYHGEIKERMGRSDICCWDGKTETCYIQIPDAGKECGVYTCDCSGANTFCSWDKDPGIPVLP